MEYPSGWNCERTLVELELYIVGTMARSDSLAVAEHLEACPGCAQRLVLTQAPTRPSQRG